MSAPSLAWPLVARGSQLRAILADLGSTVRLVTLHGTSGVGKSRVLGEAADRWEAAGRPVLRLRGDATLSILPFASLGPLLASASSGTAMDAASILVRAREAVTTLSPRGPLLVTVDDVPQVDALSAALLVQLLDLRAILLIVAAREGEPLPEAISGAAASGDARRVDLAPLTERQVGQVLTRALGGQVSNRTVFDAAEASGGNPLLLRELVAGALSSGMLSEVDGVWQWDRSSIATTPTLLDLVQARLTALSPVARSALERVALCAELPLAELPAAERAAVDELEHADLAVVRDGVRGLVVSPAHPQYAAATRARISRSRAFELLIEQADLARVHDPIRAAVYRLEAGAPDTPELLADAAVLARDLAEPATAARLADAAVRAGDERPETLAVLGDALSQSGRSSEAASILGRALAQVEAESPGSELHGRIVAAVALATATQGDRMTQAIDLVRAFLADHPAQAGLVAGEEAYLLYLEGRVDEALQAIEAGVQSGGPGRLAVLAALPLAAAGRASAATARLDEARSDPGDRNRAFTLLASSWVNALIGELGPAERDGRAALAAAIERTDETTAIMAEFVLAHVATERGDLTAARRWYADVVSGAAARGPAWLRKPAADGVRLCDVLLGASEVDAVGSGPRWRAAIMRAWTEPGPGSAADELQAIGERMLDAGDLEHGTRVLHVLVRLGVLDGVTERLEEVAARTDSPLLRLRADHARAVRDGDIAALEALGPRWQDHGFLLYAAECWALAAMLASADGASTRAITDRRTAEAILGELPGIPMSPAVAFSAPLDPLSARERDIAARAARGMSSKAIAAELVLSSRTVDNHLQAVYRKLGIAGRSELRDHVALAD